MEEIDIARQAYKMEELIRRADPPLSIAEEMFIVSTRLTQYAQQLEQRIEKLNRAQNEEVKK